jgi:ribonuclease-3
VLDLAVARLLYDAHPRWSEGDLTRARAALVNSRTLARCARELGLGAYARLGRTERKTGGADKERILATSSRRSVRSIPTRVLRR